MLNKVNKVTANSAWMVRGGTLALGLALLVGGCSSGKNNMMLTGLGGSGQGGAGGAGVDSGGADADMTAAKPSMGCGTAPTQTAEQYVRFALTVTGADVPTNATDRSYYVRLPANYDPGKPYRTVYLGPGCNPPQEQCPETRHVYALEQASGEQAILVAMEAGQYNKAEYSNASCTAIGCAGTTNPCHYCFADDAATATASPIEYAYFDALHKAVEAAYCVDTRRQFYAGYSSGGWMAQQLGCAFPDVLRAQGNVTGGLPPSIKNGAKTCVDHPIAALLIHDSQDASNPFQGSVDAAARLFALNHCGGAFTPPAINSPASYTINGFPNIAGSFNCVNYDTCPVAYPIVFCVSLGKQHLPQDTAAVPGFWQFFEMF